MIETAFFSFLLVLIGIVGYVGGYADGFEHGKKAASKTAP